MPDQLKHIYVQHYRSLQLRGARRGTPLLTRVIQATLGAAFEVCFRTGSLLVSGTVGSWKAAVRDVTRTRERAGGWIPLLTGSQLRQSLLTFLAISLLASAGLFSAQLAARAVDLKGRVLGQTKDASELMATAGKLAKEQDVAGAQVALLRAAERFSSARAELVGEGGILSNVAAALPTGRTASNLLEAAQLLSGAGDDLLSAYQLAGSFSLSGAGLTASGDQLPLHTMSVQLAAAAEKVDRAAQLTTDSDPSSLPEPYRTQLMSAQAAVPLLSSSLHSARSLAELADALFSGDRRVLILFENSNELRAGGGFIGTVGFAHMKGGRIEELKVTSVYDYDGQLQERIAPPGPLQAVNSRWYLRDSNWFADFKQSAKAAGNFFEKSGGESPDVIIAMTPALVEQLLAVTGPITAGTPPTTFTPETFLETMQAASDGNTADPLNEPKQVVADLLSAMLAKLAENSKANAPQVLTALITAIGNRQVAIYSRDASTEAKLEQLGWSGSIESSDRDYLMVVSSNLGGTKTDRSVTTEANLTSSVGLDGSVTNVLTVTRKNKLPDRPGADNLSYLRILVPLGSELLESNGFDFREQDTPALSGLSDDPAVHAWERSLRRDVLSGTTSGTEGGKTFFANWMKLSGGAQKTVTLTYRLPYKLAPTDRQTLTVQRQLGAEPLSLSYSVKSPGRRVAWDNFGSEGETLTAQRIVTGGELLGLVLVKNK